MAGEQELAAFFNVVKAATEGKEIISADYIPAAQQVAFELDNGVILRMSVADIITAALEA